MEDDSWEEFFTFPPDEDDDGGKDEMMAEEFDQLGMDECLEGTLSQGDLNDRLEDNVSALPPNAWTLNPFQETAPDFGPYTFDPSLLFAMANSFNMAAPATSPFQNESLITVPITEVQANNPHTDQMDIDPDSLSVIQTAENFALFGGHPSVPQNDLSVFDINGTNWITDPLPATSFEFSSSSVTNSYYVGSTSQFRQFDPQFDPQFDFRFQDPVTSSDIQYHDLAQQGSREIAIMNNSTAPRRRTRRKWKEIEFGNNKHGRSGTQRCDACRKRNSKCVFTHPWKPCEFCLHRNIDEPCVKKWGQKRQAKEPIWKVIPILDNARLAPEDRLLYQYVFTDEFGKSTVGRFVHAILRQLSVGGYDTSVQLRNAVLYTAAVKLGIQSEREHHFVADVLGIYRRNGNLDNRIRVLVCRKLEIDPRLKYYSLVRRDLALRGYEQAVELCTLVAPEGVYPVDFFVDEEEGFWILLFKSVPNDLGYQFGGRDIHAKNDLPDLRMLICSANL